MKAVRLVAIVVILAVLALAVWYKESENPEEARRRELARVRPDVTDPDFLATICSTKNTLVFKVQVRKVNPKADKQFVKFDMPVGLKLTDKNGKVYALPRGGCRYSEEVDDPFTSKDPPVLDSIDRLSRVIRDNLPPGVYQVTPLVRIHETGKHRLRGPYADGGTVAVPAANSLKITLKRIAPIGGPAPRRRQQHSDTSNGK